MLASAKKTNEQLSILKYAYGAYFQKPHLLKRLLYQRSIQFIFRNS